MAYSKIKILIFLAFIFLKNSCISQNEILIFNANIVDVNSGKIIKNRSILIENQTIKSIGNFNKLKTLVKKENQIDAKNKFIIPGLWDNHVHFEGQNLVEDNEALFKLFIAHGITTVRDCASDLGMQVLSWRDEINDGKRLGPTIYTAGRKLEGINSIWKGDLEISNEVELNQMLNLLDSLKIDFVKITENTLQGDLFLKSVLAAKKRGYLVSGHVPYDLTIDDLAKAGFSAIEHASYVLRLGSDENETKTAILNGTLTKAQAEKNYLQNFNQEKAINGYKELAKKGVAVCPTLIGGKQLAYLDENNHKNDAFHQYLTNQYMANYQWRIDRMANDTPEQKMQRKIRYQLIAKQIPLLQQAGVNIIAGSDAAALNTFVYPAESLIEELSLFQNAGMRPNDILKSATINGAKFLKVENKTGSIEVGKIADLVLLDENPLVNINAIEHVNAVFLKGTYFNRSALDGMLNDVKNTKNKLDSSRKN